MRVTMMQLGRWAVLVLTLALLPLGQLVTAASAHAESPGAPGDIGSVCFLGLDGTTTGCAPTKLPSPGLISPHYLGSDETRAAMHRLENQAVALTLADHNLPASDAEAVKGWAHADAQAELWALIVKAIKTPAKQRTPDQQSAVIWIASMDRSLKAWAGRNAGLEYTKWAGLSTQQYWELVNSGAGVDQLTDFLHSSTQPYGPGGEEKATDGYCRYKPPAPYQDEYDGSTAQTCYTPCVNALGCYVPTPTYDQIARWGATTTATATTGSPGYLTASLGIQSAATFGEAMAGAGVTAAGIAGLGASGWSTGFIWSGNLLNLGGNWMIGTKESPQLMVNYAATETQALAAEEAAAAAPEDVLLSEQAAELAELSDLAADVMTVVDEDFVLGAFEGAGEFLALEGAGLAAAAAIVIWAITTAVLEGIRVFDNDSLPGKVAQLVVGSRDTTPDPAASIDSPEGAAGLFHDFVFATMPAPTNDASCRDRPSLTDYRLGLVKDLGEGSFLYYSSDDGHLGTPVERDGYQCLNPTPLPEPRETDPQFLVEPRVRQAGDPAKPTPTDSITWADPAFGLKTTARLSDTWFLRHQVFFGQASDTQSLTITYRDWDGVAQRAWLMPKTDGDYAFVGVPVGSDAADAGWSSTSIHYVGTDGRDYQASVVGYQASVGSPTYGPRNPVEGSPVWFAASNFGPGGGPVMAPVQTWRFQSDFCNGPCRTTGGIDNPALVPLYGSPVTGRGVDHTFQAPGTYTVELTVTDPQRGKAVTTFEVVVGGVAPTLDLAAPPGHGLTNTPVPLAGNLTHTGTGDHEHVTIDWGDGTLLDTAEAGGIGLWAGITLDTNPVQTHTRNDTQFGIDAHHTYARPGAWQVTVVATDTAGQTDTQTVVEHIHGPQTIAFTLPTQRRYGDRIALRATGGGGSQPVTFTTTPDTVCTTDTDGDTDGDAPALVLVGTGDCTVTANQAGDTGRDPLYGPAAPTTQTIHVDPAPLEVTVAPVNRVYGSTPTDYDVRARGLVRDDTVADLEGLTIAGAPADAHAGQYPIVASGITDPRYDVSYQPATEVIKPAPLTVTTEDKSRRYGDPVPTYTARFDGLVNHDQATDITGPTGLSFTGAAANARPGSYPIGLSGTPTNPDYTYQVRAGSETVTPAPLTVTADDVTVASGHPAHYTWTVTGLVNGDTALRTPPVCKATVAGVPAATSTRPGAYAKAITCSGGTADGYAIAYVPGSLTIDPVISIDLTGLPDTVDPHATLDGHQIALPMAPTEVAYGSTHTMELPVVVDPDRVLHVSTAGFAGSLTDDLDVVATYTTMADLVDAARAEGLVATDADTLLARWTAIEKRVAGPHPSAAQTAINGWLNTVKNWRHTGRLFETSADSMTAFAQTVSTQLVIPPTGAGS